MCCDLMSTKDQSNKRPSVEETREVNDDSAPVSKTNDTGLVSFTRPIMICVLWNLSLTIK
jgi:hypothetical protein